MSRYNFLAYWLYGHDQTRQEEISIEDRDRYARAILTIAAGDGLSAREKDYFVNLARALDMPDNVAEGYATYDTKSSTLEELLAPIRGRGPVPYLIYDAIKVASVDGYSEKERACVDRAAQLLGIESSALRALESVVEAENALRQVRLALFSSMEPRAK